MKAGGFLQLGFLLDSVGRKGVLVGPPACHDCIMDHHDGFYEIDDLCGLRHS